MISPEAFKVKVENFIYGSDSHVEFWRFIRRSIIEGYWVSGKYMPPQLFLYINLWHIELFKRLPNGTFSLNRSISKPDLRDLEWERAYILMEAKGFSGFSDDTEYHCINNPRTGITIPTDKKYVNPREYLRKIHPKNLGKPLYQNNAKNVFDLESRGAGKSFWLACILVHNYLTDGIMDYDEYLANKASDSKYTVKSLSIAGAIDDIFLKRLTPKMKLGLDWLEGGQTVNGIYYPSPISKVQSGSWNKAITSSLEVQRQGKKETVGTGSSIEINTFGGSEFKASGGRCQIAGIDEVGFMFNLKNILGTLRDNTIVDQDKFGVIWCAGTGGEMDASAIAGIKDVFYNPQNHEFLVFNDIYEGKGNCGFFIPKYMTYGEYKDEYGNTRIEEAKAAWEKDYEKVLATKDQVVIDKFLINQPGLPSHAFLTKEGAVFPTDLIKKQIDKVKSTKELREKGVRGDIFYENGKAVFKNEVELNKRLYEVSFPYNREKDNSYGCITIYEFPQGQEASYKYIAGYDPVAHAIGDSLPSMFIFKRATLDDPNGDILVAEITGRFDKFRDHLEKSRLLLMMYNGKCLYENNHNHFKEHLDSTHSLQYLAHTPNTFTATVTTARKYGLPMTNPDLRLEIEALAYEWLTSPNPAGGINLDHIYSLNLLEELLVYDGNKTNTDRADAFLLTIAYKVSLSKKIVKEQKESNFASFMNKKQRVEKYEIN